MMQNTKENVSIFLMIFLDVYFPKKIRNPLLNIFVYFFFLYEKNVHNVFFVQTFYEHIVYLSIYFCSYSN